MTLQQYLDDAPETEARDEVWEWAVEVLAQVGLSHVRETVENECRLPESAWDDLLAALTKPPTNGCRP